MRLRDLRYIPALLRFHLLDNPCCYTQNPDALKRRKGDR